MPWICPFKVNKKGSNNKKYKAADRLFRQLFVTRFGFFRIKFDIMRKISLPLHVERDYFKKNEFAI